MPSLSSISARSAGVRFLASNGTMHQATRLSRSKMSFAKALRGRGCANAMKRIKMSFVEISVFVISFDHLSISDVILVASRPQLLIFQLQICNRYGIIERLSALCRSEGEHASI